MKRAKCEVSSLACKLEMNAVKVRHVFSDGSMTDDITGVIIPEDNDIYRILKDYAARKEKETAAAC